MILLLCKIGVFVMKKKTILSFLLSMFILMMPVYAAEITSINIEDGDMIHITSSGSVSKYCIGTKVGNGTCYDSTSNDVRISSMNGSYLLWVVDSNGIASQTKTVDVVNSCTDTTVPNGTGSGSYTRCFKTTSNAYIDPLPETTGEVVRCAPGYSLNAVRSIMQSNDCNLKAGAANQVLGGIRYCTRVYAYLCETSGISSPYLSSLSVSGVNLSPSFSEKQLAYAAVVEANVSSITINATTKDSGASYVDGLSPRTVNLNYGVNTIYIKVKSSTGNIATYTLTITRKDARSNNANLRSLTVSSGTLSPKFNANTINYNVSVAENVSSISVGASLADTKSSFVPGYAPRNVSLNYGANNVQIRVKSEIGTVRTYTINVNRAGSTPSTPTEPQTPDTPTGNSEALLKSLVINDGEVKLDFDQKIFNYNVHVPFDTTNLLIVGESEDASDTVIVDGGTDLQVGENEVRVTVSNANGKSNVYTLYVIRKDEEESISSNSYLTNIIVKGKKLKFDAKKNEYNLTITEKEKELDITAVPADENSVITIEGNENLKVGSQIKITVTAEDGSIQEYYLNISGIKKSANVFLIIFVVLIIIVVIAYLLLRIMGYKIYFNLDAVKSLLPSKKKKK